MDEGGPGEAVRAVLLPRPAEGGTGLGMSIVKSIVDAHDGTLSFTSEKGKGTCFRIIHPDHGGERPSGDALRRPRAVQRRRDVLDKFVACSITYLAWAIPGSVTVAQKTLDLFVGVRILPGKGQCRGVRGRACESGPFVYRLGHEILNLKRGVRFP